VTYGDGGGGEKKKRGVSEGCRRGKTKVIEKI